jgi:hypothetical protein
MLFFKKNNPKELRLNYEISAGIPYKWEYEIKDESIVKFNGFRVTRDDNKGGKVGGKVAKDYIFVGLKEGETTITFRFVYISGRVENEEVHHVIVDKDLNIKEKMIAIDK